ncbi:hypothetical protein INH39_13925 [Massilia violaceinigra]|uniref:Uncharacterized protein n=1 Tax=Massilia violaceinigra TaxID=2045208 RepID=A0ABY4AG80_9BURK|nr:hypothetical protein [Massilia violaceinigra]UOD32654.1 hypothetical protein INH39_13925 [Massilia violaceinigra]
MKLMIDLNSFYSAGDERRFFEGLGDNPAVSGYRGIAHQLQVSIVQKHLNHDTLRELIALFYRYQIPIAPLAPLAENKRFAWLADERWYWHQSMIT